MTERDASALLLIWESLTEVDTRRHRLNLFVMDLIDIWSLPLITRNFILWKIHASPSQIQPSGPRWQKWREWDWLSSITPGYQWGRSNETIYVHVQESRDTPRTSQQSTVWYNALILPPRYGKHGEDEEDGLYGTCDPYHYRNMWWKPQMSWRKIIGKMTKKTNQVSCPSHQVCNRTYIKKSTLTYKYTCVP